MAATQNAWAWATKSISGSPLSLTAVRSSSVSPRACLVPASIARSCVAVLLPPAIAARSPCTSAVNLTASILAVLISKGISNLPASKVISWLSKSSIIRFESIVGIMSSSPKSFLCVWIAVRMLLPPWFLLLNIALSASLFRHALRCWVITLVCEPGIILLQN